MTTADTDLKTVIEYYNREASGYLAKFQDEVYQKPYDKAFLDLFSSQLPPGGVVLDIGCSSACQQARYLASLGHGVAGIDLSEESIRLARGQWTGIELFSMNMLEMTFPNDSFDGVSAFYSFIHIPRRDSERLLQGVRRVLRPGGRLAIAVHKGEFEGVLEGYSVFFRSFRNGELDELLTETGFEVLHRAERKPLYESEYPSDRLYYLARKLG